MAQLVNGKARELSLEFETLLRGSASEKLQQHPDWSSLDDLQAQFVLNFFCVTLIQNACSFNRRITSYVESFPLVLLKMVVVRYDIPYKPRKHLAQEMLERARRQTLDLNSLKILKAYRADIEMAANSGCFGVQLYVCLKALSRLVKSDTRESERINKQLSLYGERAPNISLELLSARLCLKYNLGIVGARQEGISLNTPKKWSLLKPLAGIVLDKCLHHWFDGGKLLANLERFAAPSVPEWCPSQQDASVWHTALSTGDSAEKGTSVNHLVSATINRKLYNFFHRTDKSPKSNISEPCFAAIAFAPVELQAGRPHTLKAGTPVYLYGELVNRAVRLLAGTWGNEGNVIIKQPWMIDGAADIAFEWLQLNL